MTKGGLEPEFRRKQDGIFLSVTPPPLTSTRRRSIWTCTAGRSFSPFDAAYQVGKLLRWQTRSLAQPTWHAEKRQDGYGRTFPPASGGDADRCGNAAPIPRGGLSVSNRIIKGTLPSRMARSAALIASSASRSASRADVCDEPQAVLSARNASLPSMRMINSPSGLRHASSPKQKQGPPAPSVMDDTISV